MTCCEGHSSKKMLMLLVLLAGIIAMMMGCKQCRERLSSGNAE